MNKIYYSGTISQFQRDNERGRFIPHMLKAAGLSTEAQSSEIESWKNNAKEIVRLLNKANLPDDVFMAFEYSAPISGRIDWMLFGKDENGVDNVIVVELKQWGNEVTVSEYGKNIVNVFTGGQYQEVEHPSAQVRSYCNRLRGYVDMFSSGKTNLTGIAYCYNYRLNKENVCLLDSAFNDLTTKFPLYTKDSADDMLNMLSKNLAGGCGEEIYNKLVSSPEKQTPELIRSVANIVTSKDSFFNLLGDQSVAYETFSSLLQDSLEHPERKNVLIVKGGPGTGKTVIALKILAEQAAKGRTVYYTTRSTALKTQLQENLKNSTLADNRMASNIVRPIFDFRPYGFKEGEIDVLIVDEAHRVQNSPNDQTDGNRKVVVEYDGDQSHSVYCPISQDLSLMYCAKVTIFLIDDQQAVRGGEIGLSKKIHKSAVNYQNDIQKQIEDFKIKFAKDKPAIEQKICDLEDRMNDVTSSGLTDKEEKDLKALKRELLREDCYKNIRANVKSVNVIEKELHTQFRCQGAETLTKWLDEVLYKPSSEIDIILPKNEYDFQIMDNIQELHDLIVSKSKETDGIAEKDRVTARMIAGWCWPWSDKPDENGDLREEIEITNHDGSLLKMKWETKAKIKKEFRTMYPKDAHHWATDPRGVNQMGCAFSAQGFEFDYVGIVLGPDIDYDAHSDRLVTLKEHNFDNKVNSKGNKHADEQIRNIYRVLLTRGRRGCYVYCCNPGVSDYLKRFMEK